MPFTYEYERPGVTVDIVLFADTGIQEYISQESNVLLIRRGDDPFKGSLALPGGFVNPQEDLEAAALRELNEETNVKKSDVLLKQLCAVGTPYRDPRGHTISIVFTAYHSTISQLDVRAGDDAAEVMWVPMKDLDGHELAFDHKSLILKAYDHWYY